MTCGVCWGTRLNVPLWGRGGLCDRLEISDSPGRGVGLGEEGAGELVGLDYVLDRFREELVEVVGGKER